LKHCPTSQTRTLKKHASLLGTCDFPNVRTGSQPNHN
jgi:hypothetical protein